MSINFPRFVTAQAGLTPGGNPPSGGNNSPPGANPPPPGGGGELPPKTNPQPPNDTFEPSPTPPQGSASSPLSINGGDTKSIRDQNSLARAIDKSSFGDNDGILTKKELKDFIDSCDKAMQQNPNDKEIPRLKKMAENLINTIGNDGISVGNG